MFFFKSLITFKHTMNLPPPGASVKHRASFFPHGTADEFQGLVLVSSKTDKVFIVLLFPGAAQTD